MTSPFFQSAAIRSGLISLYRIYARSQVWREGPRVFVNSIPKAGTHLVTSWLDRIPQLQHSRLWVRERFVNANGGYGERVSDFEFDRSAFDSHLATVRNGQFFTGHLQSGPELLAALQEGGVRTLFVKRHPLDVLVSQFHYIKGLRRHSKHAFFMGLASDDDRINVLMRGSNEPHIIGMADQLRAYRGWHEAPGVFPVSFEDLVGERGGGADSLRDRTHASILEFLGLPADALGQQATPAASATFRKGKMNAWAELLTPDRLSRLTDDDRQAIHEFGYDI